MLIEVRQWLPQGLWRKMPRKDTHKNFLEIYLFQVNNNLCEVLKKIISDFSKT